MSRPASDRAAILAAETGTIRKPPGFPIRMALAFPNRYQVGMSNLGFQLVYRLSNARSDTVCERMFYEPDWCSPAGEPLALESGDPARRFNILAFSLNFENDYPNVLAMLHESRIPLLASDRGQYDPLVIAGGIAVTANPEPLAPFFDLFVLGDAEATLPSLLNRFRELQGSGADRRMLWTELAKQPGIYNPHEFQPEYDDAGQLVRVTGAGTPRRQLLMDLQGTSALAPIRTARTIFTNFALVDVARGCPRSCRFCLLQNVHQPFRYRTLESILEQVTAEAPLGTTVGLVGASLAEVPYLARLCRELLALGYQPSLSSFRADRMTPELLELLPFFERQTLTLAPECGTERLRERVGKPMSDEQFLETVKALGEQRLPHLKLYFMIGVPGETAADLAAIPKLVGHAAHVLRAAAHSASPQTRLTISVSCFTPKPWTPFQWEPMSALAGLKEALADLKRRFRDMAGVAFIHDVPKWSHLEGLLSRGDRRTAALLLAVNRASGNWAAALRSTNINPSFYTTRPREPTEILPWDHLASTAERLRLLHCRALYRRGHRG